MRTTVAQLQLSDFPQVVGLNPQDLPGICKKANRAIQTLMDAGGETGFWGMWSKVVFTVTQASPYITLPPQYCRLINADICRRPVQIQNEFYEELWAGVGLQGWCSVSDWCGMPAGYERGVFPSMVDASSSNQYLMVMVTDPRDVGKSIIIGPALDQNGNPIYTTIGNQQVNGFQMVFAQPQTTSPMIVSAFTAVQKDITYGDVLLYQVDATTGAQVLLSRYAAWEQNPAYRRYFFNGLPCNCCGPCTTPGSALSTTGISVTAMCRLEYIPVSQPTDQLIVGNIPALIEMAKSIRFSDMDKPESLQQAEVYQKRAIRILNQEMGRYLGKLNPATNVAVFGTARFARPMRAVKYG